MPAPAPEVPAILALIPARSGSKSIPDKNIRPLAGKPLLAHSIEQARASRLIQRTIVSTDSPRYAEIARRYGAETPFLRPARIAGDHATDLEVFRHALAWLEENQGYRPQIVVHLRPTYPLRRVEEIDRAIGLLLEHPEADSLRSVAPARQTPFKMWFRDQQGLLFPVLPQPIPEAWNLPRQLLPPVYFQNACIDVVRARVIKEQGSMTGRRILGLVMDHCLDIDHEEDFQRARACLESRGTDRAELLKPGPGPADKEPDSE